MPGSIYIRGDSVSLHTIHQHDYAYVERLHNDPAVRPPAGITTPWHQVDVEERVEEREDISPFLICRNDDPVGFVELSETDATGNKGEIGYIIQPSEHGNGYATEGAKLCLQYAFQDRGLHKVWAQVGAVNTASIRVLEKLDFQQEGLLREHKYSEGEFVDVYRYGLLRAEW